MMSDSEGVLEVSDASFGDCEAAWMARHQRWLDARAVHVAACDEATRGAATKRAQGPRRLPSREGKPFSAEDDAALRRVWGIVPPTMVNRFLRRCRWSDIVRRATELGILLRPIRGLVAWSAAARALRVSRAGLLRELRAMGVVPRVVRLGAVIGGSGTYARPSQWATAYGRLRRRLVGFGDQAEEVARRRALRVLEPLVRVPHASRSTTEAAIFTGR